MRAEEFTQQPLVRSRLGFDEMDRLVALEPAPDRVTGGSGQPAATRRETAARRAHYAAGHMREGRVVGFAKRGVAKRAAGKLGSESQHRDDAPTGGQSVLDGSVRG